MQTRRGGFLATVLAMVTLMLTMAGAMAQQGTPADALAPEADLQAAVSWLTAQQADDGGFPGMSGESEASITIDAIIALAAAGEEGIDTGDAIDEAVGWLTTGDTALVMAQTGQGQAAKLVLGAVAAGIDPTDIAGVDPVALIDAGVNPDTGMYGSGIFDHALVMLALAATGSDVPDEAIAGLEATQTPEGGWSFDGTATSGAADSNTTALVVQALVAAGEDDSPMVSDALGYLLTATTADGAVFQPGADQPADSSSTAMVAQAVIAAGDDPASDGWGDLPGDLSGFQGESGAFFFNADDQTDNLFSTVQVIPALAGEPLPVAPANTATPVALRPLAAAVAG